MSWPLIKQNYMPKAIDTLNKALKVNRSFIEIEATWIFLIFLTMEIIKISVKHTQDNFLNTKKGALPNCKMMYCSYEAMNDHHHKTQPFPKLNDIIIKKFTSFNSML